MALPAAAHAATVDLGVTQTQSATVVPKGTAVTFTAEVKNLGTAGAESVFVELGSLAAFSLGADAPYLSFSTTQGTCADRSSEAYGSVYHYIVCELGPLPPGASAQVTAVAKVNQSANFSANLLPNPYEGGYLDGNNSNNSSGARITVSLPPVVAGSKRIKLRGLPAGCASGDFTLHATAKSKKVKKMLVSLFFWEGGDGVTWQKRANGKSLAAKVPVSRLSNELGKSYKLKIKAKIRGTSRFLTKTVTFERC